MPLKKTYSVDSTMEEILSNPKTISFLGSMMDVDTIPDIVYALSLRGCGKDVCRRDGRRAGEDAECGIGAVLIINEGRAHGKYLCALIVSVCT